MKTAAERRYQRERSRREPTPVELEIHNRWTRGESQTALAKEFGYEKSSVHRLVKRVAQWRNHTESDSVEAIRETTISELTKLAAEAVGGWERSKLPTVRTRKGKSGDNEVDETTTTTSAGDPRFIEAATKILEARSRLAGCSGQPVQLTAIGQQINIESMPIELRAQVANLARWARGVPEDESEAASEIPALQDGSREPGLDAVDVDA